MFSLNDKVSIRQLQTLLIIEIFGAGVIILPRKAAQYAGQDAWVLITITTILAVCSVYLMTGVGRLYPQSSFISIASNLLSKPVGRLIGVLFIAKLLFNCAIELRLFGEILRQSMLPRTPFTVICAIMISISAYAAAKGYEARARLAQILFPLLFIPFVFVFFLGLFEVDLTNLMPVFTARPDNILLGSVRVGTAFTGLELLLLVTPFAVRPLSVRKGMIQAVIFVGALMIFVTTVTIAKFGPLEVTRQLWPVLEMMDFIDLPGSFIERQDALFMSFWIISIFAIINASLFFSAILLRDVLEVGKHWFYIVLCMPIVLAGAYIMPSVVQVDYLMDIVFFTVGIGFMIVIPAILLIVATLRKVSDERGKS